MTKVSLAETAANHRFIVGRSKELLSLLDFLQAHQGTAVKYGLNMKSYNNLISQLQEELFLSITELEIITDDLVSELN